MATTRTVGPPANARWTGLLPRSNVDRRTNNFEDAGYQNVLNLGQNCGEREYPTQGNILTCGL